MIAVISFSHKSLDISVREKIALPQDEIASFYTSLLAHFPSIAECILLSTCNRFELLLAGEFDEEILQKIIVFIAFARNIPAEVLEESGKIYLEDEGIRHIFQVASSLDSLVVGETQITGQLKSAYKFSFDAGFCKKELTRIVHFAFKCAASVRNQTQISKNPISVSSVAVSKFLQTNPDINQKVIVLGAGEIGKLCTKHLLSSGFSVILISRQLNHSQRLADELEGGERVEIRAFSEIAQLINTYPYLFSATGAPHSVITQEMVAPVEFERIWFDLALPRDIEQVEGVQLFVIDDLQEIVNENIHKREEELKIAQHIIDSQLMQFNQWLKSLDVEPIIKSFRQKAKECSIKEVERAIKKGYLQEELREEVEIILHNAFNKFLHHPTTYIKQIQENPESDFILDNVKRLFDLSDEEFYKNPYKCEGYFKQKGMKNEND